MIRRDDADRHDVLRGDDDGVGRHRHDRIEVAGRQRVLKIAEIVGQERVNQREVGMQRRLQQIGLSGHFDLLLALFDERADAGRRQDAAEAAAAGADALDERALRHQVDRHLAAPSSAAAPWD